VTLRVGVVATPYGVHVIQFIRQAEQLGVDSVWVPEFWAGDALTPLAFLAARTSNIRLASGIVQLGARTPAMLAMSALSLQALSGGRFVLGIGTSGPQVMEGWHGVRFDKPVQRTRETIDIIRAVTAGERLEYHGQVYELPLPGGEGRSIRSLMPPAHVPIYVAALGPNNLRLTGELADGWIGNSFFPETADVFFDPIREGAAHAGRSFDDLDLTVAVGIEFTDDVEAAGRRHAEGYAFTFGAMGSASANFYNNAFERQGYGDDVREVDASGWRATRWPRASGCRSRSVSARTSSAPMISYANAYGSIATPASRHLASDCKPTSARTSTRPSAILPVCLSWSRTSTANRGEVDVSRHDVGR
jgi:F420-dependent oxidoreductase-like protein